MPRALRWALAAQALAAIGVGLALYASPRLASSLGPWQLSGLMAQATGTRVVGTGLSAGTVALLDDRALMPGNAIAQVIFAGGVLLALARFGGEVAFAQPSAVLLVAYLAATLASGAHGVRLALREGRLAPTPVRGGIPVQLRASTTTATVCPRRRPPATATLTPGARPPRRRRHRHRDRRSRRTA